MNRNLKDTMERTAQTIARRAGVRLICRGNETPRTDGRTIVLPALPSPCSKHIERIYHGSLDHENGHIIFTTFGASKKFMKRLGPIFGERAFDVLNALEDLRIERCMVKRFPGSKDNLKAAHDEMDRRWEEHLAQREIPLWNRLVSALIKHGMGQSVTHFGEDAVALVETVSDLVVKAPRLKSTRQAADLSEEILRRWADLAERTPQRHVMGGVAESTPQSDQNREGIVEGGDVRSNATAKPGETSGKTKDTSQQDEKLAGLAKEALVGNLDGEKLPSLGETLCEAIASARDESGHVPYRVFDRSRDVVEVAPAGDPDETRSLMEEIRPQVSALRSKLLLTLRSRTQRRWVADENGPRLNRRRLHTVLMESPEIPLQRHATCDATDVAVSLLVDLSGSMRGAKIRLAQSCTLTVAECLTQIGIPHEVIGFSTADSSSAKAAISRSASKTIPELATEFARVIPTLHVLYSQFGESFRRVRDRFSTMAAHGATPLNESLVFAGRRLLGRRERRRIVVALTDGQVYTGSSELQETVEQNLQDSIASLERVGIEVVAVGMMTNSVKTRFKRHVVISDLREFPKEFLKLMSSLLVSRGARR